MKQLTTLLFALCLCTISANAAQDGSWALTTGGDYSDSGNWIDGNIADDSTSVAYFTNGITAFAVINLQTNRTIGTLNLSGEGDQWWFAGEGNSLTLDDGGTKPVINVGGNLWGASINANLSGSDGFNKTGAKLLSILTGPISGDINIEEGALRLGWENSMPNINNITVGTAGTLIIGETNTINCPLTLNRSDTGVNEFAIDVEPGKACNINSNIIMSANSGIMATGNDAVLNLNSPISGAYSLRLTGRAVDGDIGIFNLNAVNTYSSNTTFSTWGSNPRFELNVNQGIPLNADYRNLTLEVYDSSANSSVTFDLNDKTQKISSVFVALHGGQNNHSAVITGSDSSVLEVTNAFTTWEYASGTVIKQTGGKIIFNGPGFGLATKMIITNATFLNNGAWWGGPNAELDLQPGAKIGGTGFLGWETSAADLVIPAGATITPGNSIGALGCWNLEMQNGSMYDWEVENGTSSDLVDVRGLLDISSAAENSITVNVSVIGGIEPWDINTLFYTASGTEGISGDTNSILLSYEPGITGPDHPYIDVDNNMVVSDIIIPEPAALGFLAILGLTFLRRK